MKSLTTWIHRPFKPYYLHRQENLPYICRISPDEGSFLIEWYDNGFEGEHTLTVTDKETNNVVKTIKLEQKIVTVNNLPDLTDFRITISRNGAEGQTERLVRTGKIPGDTVINYLHPKDPAYSFSGKFLGSPNIIKCPSGRLISAMDIFWAKEYQSLIAPLFCSDDEGKNWRNLGELAPCFWPTLFMHKGSLYCIGATNAKGNIVIGRSDDEGENWTAPSMLFALGYNQGPEGAMGVFEHKGRVYAAISHGHWDINTFRMSYISADANSDLLDPASWEISDFIEYDPSWKNSPVDAGPGLKTPGGGIEGCMVAGPDGVLHACYRADIERTEPSFGKMILLDIDTSDPKKPYIFNSIVDCPLGSNSKFLIRYDDVSGFYIMLGTEQNPAVTPKRTVLSIAVSKNLTDWTVVHRIYDYRHEDPLKIGFQYPDFRIDGDDLLLATRVGFNESDDHHNSNCITFERIKNFRDYL